MDSYGGYKLKPETYTIQPGDIIIRIKDGTTIAPIGALGIVLEDRYLSLPNVNRWYNNYYEDWRAIETKPSSEAKTGDTVYCIEHTGGDCGAHDSFIVKDIRGGSICPPNKHKLLNGKIVQDNWGWRYKHFVVLVTVDSVSEFPCFRQSIKSKQIIRFTGPTTGIVVDPGSSMNELYYPSTSWVNYNNTEVWVPCEDPSNKKEVDPTNIVPTVIAVDSMVNKPTQTKPNSKGKQMNSSLFTDILKLLTQVEQTDLQKAPSTYAFFYNEDGEYEGTARVANEAEAKSLLQRPEHLGYTMRIYSFSDEFTTQIPVVSTIKKTVATKPVRKPRVPKAN